jgi:hypothetical protein
MPEEDYKTVCPPLRGGGSSHTTRANEGGCSHGASLSSEQEDEPWGKIARFLLAWMLPSFGMLWQSRKVAAR